MVRQLAENCTLAEQNEQLVHLNLDPAHAHLHSAALEKKLAEALNALFGREVKLRIDKAAASGDETPAQRQARVTRERQQAAERAIAEDDAVRALEETFGAQVQRDSVQPLE